MRVLSKKQQLFCKYIVVYGLSPCEAVTAAGYTSSSHAEYSYKWRIAKRLLKSEYIQAEIDRLSTEMRTPDAMKRRIIQYHYQALDFSPTDVIKPVRYNGTDGVERTRLDVLPLSEWSHAARVLCTGFDKNGYPVFRNTETSVKELSRIYGLYKDNGVKEQENLSELLKNSGLIPSMPDFDDDDDDSGIDKLIESLDDDSSDGDISVDDSDMHADGEALDTLLANLAEG